MFIGCDEVLHTSYIFNMHMYYACVCGYMVYYMSRPQFNMPCLREFVFKKEFLTCTDSEDQMRGLPEKRKKVMGSQR